MKKFAFMAIAVLMALWMLTACTSNRPGSDATTPKADVTPAPISTSRPTPTPTPNPTTTTVPTSMLTTVPTPIPTPIPTPSPSDKAAFSGTVEEILKQLISKTIEGKTVADEELKDIKCYVRPVDADSCQDVLGLMPDEFAANVAAAVESKPEGSWFAHSIVLIKGRDGVDMAALAKKIANGTNPARFGCIKAEAVVVGQAGRHIVLCAGFKATSDAIYATFSGLSAVKPIRIDRKNDWSSGLRG